MIITAFLGYNRSPKLSKFNNSHGGFNNNKLRVNSSGPKLTTQIFYSTASPAQWLAGFSDAEGCFFIRL